MLLSEQKAGASSNEQQSQHLEAAVDGAAVVAASNRQSHQSSFQKTEHSANTAANSAIDHVLYSEKRTKLLNLISQSKSLVLKLSSQQILEIPAADSGLKILHTELKFRGGGNSQSSQSFDPNRNLSSQFIHAKLIDSQDHLDRLHSRISDTRSRVLVTGDLNAGKSTFVNAMLRRECLPSDQQPCTALFAEVIDAEQNGGVEEVHGIIDPSTYKQDDPSSFQRFDVRFLRNVVEDNEQGFELLKVYARDQRDRQQSLLHNGVVDISLIDSPGLNIDSMKTTALFAQQDEIDVVVFVVNAENHFTLSVRFPLNLTEQGREFLQIAGREKAYIFIVVNRFDMIKRRVDRCRGEILDQIRQISPQTYADAESLVHFVSAKQCLEETPDNPTNVEDFMKLEDCLRSFVLEKRSKSKLAPGKMYLENLLSDISAIASHNILECQSESEAIGAEIHAATPTFRSMLDLQFHLEDLDAKIDTTCDTIQSAIYSHLADFVDNIDYVGDDVEWPGVLYALTFARNVRELVYSHAQRSVDSCGKVASGGCIESIDKVDILAKKCCSNSDEMRPDKQGCLEILQQRQWLLPPPPEYTEFLDTSDKVGIIREFGPAFGLFGIGLAGFKGAFRGFLGGTFQRNTFAGIAIAGVGLFFFALSDIRRVLVKKVVGKIRIHLNESGFVQTNADRIVKQSRKCLTGSLYDFSNRFNRLVKHSQQTLESQNEKKSICVTRGRELSGMYEDSQRLRGLLDAIDFS